MTDSTLAAIYKGWETYQGHMIGALAPLSNDQLALDAGPGARSISVIARHVIAARVYWFHAIIGLGKAETYAEMQTWDDFEEPVRNASDIVRGLKTTWGLMQEALRQWTTSDLETPFTFRHSNGEEETFTRQWIIWHIIEHDVHHGGEISLALGRHGLKGLDI